MTCHINKYKGLINLTKNNTQDYETFTFNWIAPFLKEIMDLIAIYYYTFVSSKSVVGNAIDQLFICMKT